MFNYDKEGVDPRNITNTFNGETRTASTLRSRKRWEYLSSLFLFNTAGGSRPWNKKKKKKKTVWEGSKLSLFIHDIKVWTKISMDYVKTFRMNKWL